MAEEADDLSSLITELQENKLFKMKKNLTLSCETSCTVFCYWYS